MPPSPQGVPGEVTLGVPAQGAFLSLIRTTTAAVGARANLTIEEIEDLRLAVDEAAALLIPHENAERRVDVTFTFSTAELTITLASATGSEPPPDQTGFGWTVLAALAGSVNALSQDGVTTITLTHRRASAG